MSDLEDTDDGESIGSTDSSTIFGDAVADAAPVDAVAAVALDSPGFGDIICLASS
jgi:hypothetical protein